MQSAALVSSAAKRLREVALLIPVPCEPGKLRFGLCEQRASGMTGGSATALWTETLSGIRTVSLARNVANADDIASMGGSLGMPPGAPKAGNSGSTRGEAPHGDF
jgi:hypothetical protein